MSSNSKTVLTVGEPLKTRLKGSSVNTTKCFNVASAKGNKREGDIRPTISLYTDSSIENGVVKAGGHTAEQLADLFARKIERTTRAKVERIELHMAYGSFLDKNAQTFAENFLTALRSPERGFNHPNLAIRAPQLSEVNRSARLVTGTNATCEINDQGATVFAQKARKIVENDVRKQANTTHQLTRLNLSKTNASQTHATLKRVNKEKQKIKAAETDYEQKLSAYNTAVDEVNAEITAAMSAYDEVATLTSNSISFNASSPNIPKGSRRDTASTQGLMGEPISPTVQVQKTVADDTTGASLGQSKRPLRGGARIAPEVEYHPSLRDYLQDKDKFNGVNFAGHDNRETNAKDFLENVRTLTLSIVDTDKAPLATKVAMIQKEVNKVLENVENKKSGKTPINGQRGCYSKTLSKIEKIIKSQNLSKDFPKTNFFGVSTGEASGGVRDANDAAKDSFIQRIDNYINKRRDSMKGDIALMVACCFGVGIPIALVKYKASWSNSPWAKLRAADKLKNCVSGNEVEFTSENKEALKYGDLAKLVQGQETLGIEQFDELKAELAVNTTASMK